MITKPMLAAKLDSEDQIQFPIWCTKKLDGIRCLVIDGHAVTRKFKPVPNKYIREQIERFCPDGFDGEIMSGEVDFNSLQSLVMREEGEPKFEYHVFDYVKESLDREYLLRVSDLIGAIKVIRADFVKAVVPEEAADKEALLKLEQDYLSQGYEGIIVRTAKSPYKCGRSTIKQQWLMKLKRFLDAEAEIIGSEQLMHNNNEATIDELGHTKRSSHKENMIPVEKIGAFVVIDLKTKVEFKVSTGMDDAQRTEYWKTKTDLVGKIVKYKYQNIGPNGRPRFPVFLGFRDKIDL